MGKKKSKKVDAVKVAKRLAKLDAIIEDKSRPKAERKAAKRERVALVSSVAERYDFEHDDIVATAPELVPGEATVDDVIAAADRVLADEGASEGAKAKAAAARKRAERAAKLEAARAEAAAEPPVEPEPVDDAAVARRVHAKRLLRKAVGVSGNPLAREGKVGELIVDPDDVPRDSAELVAAYNEVIGRATGHYLTSDDEREAIAERIAPPVKAADEPRDEAVDKPAGIRVMAEPETIAEHEAVEVETEAGTVFAVGPAAEGGDEQPAAPGFAAPSDAPRQLEEGRNGYKVVVLNADGQPDLKRDGTPRTVRQFTRVTSYIDVLSDKTALAKWKQRLLIEGIVANETAVGTWDEAREDAVMPPHLLAEARDLIHARDVAIAKARKADRKGKLGFGELGSLIDDANKTYRDGLNALAEQALELAGAHDAATRGTNLHALTEVYDEHGIEPIAAMLDRGEITPADFADLEAYGAAMKRAGIRVLEREVVVVNDELKVAGRLDKVVLAKASPDAQRATRMVADLKTGSVDYDPGKVAQQLELYATSKGYDLDTFERRDLKLSRTTALLIHLKAGSGVCTVHVVDLVAGRHGNRLAGEVRRWRNESRKSIDFAVDLAAPRDAEPEGDES